MKYKSSLFLALLSSAGLLILPAEGKQANARNASKTSKGTVCWFIPKPTFSEVPYGTHERHVLDFGKQILTNQPHSYSSFMAVGKAEARNGLIVLSMHLPC